ncbi:MAG: sigma-70 family RNA polymerase sigma factor [Gemmatimonadales bacterium]
MGSTATPERRAWFEREVVAMLPDLYGAAMRLVKNEADAEDLAADAVAKAWLHLDELKEEASFRGWVFRTLTNTFLSRCRTQAVRGVEEPLDEEEGLAAEASFSLFERLHQPVLLWWGNPEREFLNKLLREDLARALDGLSEAFRVVVLLADVQGLSYREIAAAVGVPIGTVRSRLARGRALLQQTLWAHAVDAGLVAPRTTNHTAAS